MDRAVLTSLAAYLTLHAICPRSTAAIVVHHKAAARKYSLHLTLSSGDNKQNSVSHRRYGAELGSRRGIRSRDLWSFQQRDSCRNGQGQASLVCQLFTWPLTGDGQGQASQACRSKQRRSCMSLPQLLRKVAHLDPSAPLFAGQLPG